MSGAVNGGVPKAGLKRIGPIGVRSRSAALAHREARFKALARELLRQAQLAADRGDQQFKRQRLSEVERVLANLNPASGQAEFRAHIDRLTDRKQPAPSRPTPTKRRRGQAKPCADCGVRDVNRAKKYCDECATRRGFLLCPKCQRMFHPVSRSTLQFRLCPKCAPKYVDQRQSTSVRTVSGGLPTLGKRR